MAAKLPGRENSWGMVIGFRERSREGGRGESEGREERGREDNEGREELRKKGGAEGGAQPSQPLWNSQVGGSLLLLPIR